MFADQIKIPRNIKTEVDIPFTPCPGGLTDILRFDHTLGIGKYELKNVATGFYVPAK